MTTAEDVIAQAERWVGFVEGPRNDNPFGRWYGMPNVAYCAQAVSYWTAYAGLPVPASTSKGYAYTPSGANWFQAQGRWGTTPRKGAHVFFRFSGDRIHHVGLVTSDDGVFPIETIEANTSRGAAGSQRDGGGVWRRARATGIVGYGYPNYDESEEDDMDLATLQHELGYIHAKLDPITERLDRVELRQQQIKNRGTAELEILRSAFPELQTDIDTILAKLEQADAPK